MARFLHSIVSSTFRKSGKFLLALSWALGLGSGGLVFRYAGSDLVSQMPLAANCQPSIFGLLIPSFFPFLFSAFAVYIGAPNLLYGISFCKAFLFGYVSFGVFAAFGNSGWLIRWMLLFTDICCVVLLYHYLLRHISGVRSFSPGALVGYLAMVSVAVGVDLCYISPLLRQALL